MASALPTASMVLGILGLVLGLVPIIGLLLALTGLILGIVALARRLPGRGRAKAGVITGALGMLVMPILLVAVVLPLLRMARGRSQESLCQNHLYGIHTAIAIYQFRQRNQHPPDLLSVSAGGYTDVELFACPVHSTTVAPVPGRVDYFYFPPSAQAPPSALLACDFVGNHGGKGRSVVDVGGTVRFLNEAGFQALLTKPENAGFAAALAAAEASGQARPMAPLTSFPPGIDRERARQAQAGARLQQLQGATEMYRSATQYSYPSATTLPGQE